MATPIRGSRARTRPASAEVGEIRRNPWWLAIGAAPLLGEGAAEDALDLDAGRCSQSFQDDEAAAAAVDDVEDPI